MDKEKTFAAEMEKSSCRSDKDIRSNQEQQEKVIDKAAREILAKYRKAFEELAK